MVEARTLLGLGCSYRGVGEPTCIQLIHKWSENQGWMIELQGLLGEEARSVLQPIVLD